MTSKRRSSDAQVKTLLVSDLVASTRLVEQLGDQRAAQVFAYQDRAARDLLIEHDGLEIDKTDGFLLLFERPIRAVRWALDYHAALATLSQQAGVELAARVGIHLGEVVLRRNPPHDVARGAKPLEVEGLAKAKAARLMSLAGARQTLLTDGVFTFAKRAVVGADDLRGRLRWLAHGSYLFQGVTEPTPVFEVGFEGFAPLEAPRGSRKARPEDATRSGWRPAPGLKVPGRPNWILERQLGERNFAEAWVANHAKTHERRAFKLCREICGVQALRHEVALFRLIKESLGDRGDIARVLDWGFDEAPYYLESEYTDDGHLGDWLEAQGGVTEVPREARLDIVAQVAEALAAVHSAGILYRHVAPVNILIRRDSEGCLHVRLSDFGNGLATEEERFADVDVTKVFPPEMAVDLGARLYTAPELVEERTPTVLADVYSLGVLLYQLVVGDLSRSLAPGWERDVEDDLLRQDIAAAVEGRPWRRPDAQELGRRLRNVECRRRELNAERRTLVASQRGRKRWQRLAAALLWIALATSGPGPHSRIARGVESSGVEGAPPLGQDAVSAPLRRCLLALAQEPAEDLQSPVESRGGLSLSIALMEHTGIERSVLLEPIAPVDAFLSEKAPN